MIPPALSPKTPLGEKELFNKLQEDPDTSGWVVLHSLDVKKHQSKIEGELDAVIFVPGLGVLCVEVKGCDVSRRDGKWIYPYETSVEGPFKQVSRAMYSLRKYVTDRDSGLDKLLFFSAVVFTRINFEESSPEWHPWQYINRAIFVRNPISANVVHILERAHLHIQEKSGPRSWYSESESRPTAGQIKKLVSILRDNFEYSVSSRRDVEELEHTIFHYTEEQFDSLDLLLENRRILFKGPAGTGKTFLALEAARRAVVDGHRVLLICYNNLLGGWLKAQTSTFPDEHGRFDCQTFHSLLLSITGERPREDSDNRYWREELPIRAVDRLLDERRSWPEYDFIVVDEAQDLLDDQYLDVLDVLLKGGLAGGRWAFFGDFERQAIYLTEDSEGVVRAMKRFLLRVPHFFSYGLRVNCRNSERIAETLTITSGLSPGYKRILHDLEGSDVDPIFYSTMQEQRELLGAALKTLKTVFKSGEIVILSMRNDKESCSGGGAGEIAGHLVAPIRKIQDAQTVAFSSIHTFKGLEAAAVVLTDIESLEDERTRALLYVGMSRARIRLFILMHESCRLSYDRILDAGLAKTSKECA